METRKTHIREHVSNIRPHTDKHSVVSKHISNFNRSLYWRRAQILDVYISYVTFLPSILRLC